MGFAPPPDLPTPPDAPPLPQLPALPLPQVPPIPTITIALPPLGVSLGFSLALPGIAFCGFAIPGFSLNLNFSLALVLPKFTFPPPLFFALALSCDLSRPFSVDFGVGGGRPGTPGLEVDAEYPD